MRAIQLKANGEPLVDIGPVDLPEPAAPAADEVLIGMEYAPVNTADLNPMMGIYRGRPRLPFMVGNEGVGRVLVTGSRVTGVRVGDRVAPRISSETWRERLVVPAQSLVVLPEAANANQLALTVLNPIAASLLLSEILNLKAGDWIAQNAADAGVGRCVIAFARDRGIKTVNIVSRAEMIDDLKAAGADVVVLDGEHMLNEVRTSTAGGDIKLALDGISGPASASLASVLSTGGTIATYGVMSAQPIMLRPADIVLRCVQSRGFFVGHPQYAKQFPVVMEQIARLIAAGKLIVPTVAIYPLSAIKNAIAHANIGGKVFLDINAV